MGSNFFGKLKWQFILMIARRLPDCKTITPVLGESIDRRLPLRQRIVVRLHLFTCEACARYLEQIEFLRAAAHRHEEMLENTAEASETSMSGDAKDRLKARLSSAAEIS